MKQFNSSDSSGGKFLNLTREVSQNLVAFGFEKPPVSVISNRHHAKYHARAGLKKLLLSFCLLFLLACSDKKSPTQEKGANPAETTTGRELEPPIGIASDKPVLDKKTPQNAGIWRYEKTIDKEGRSVRKASTISPHLLEFEFPYAGGSTTTLTIRKRESDTHVYIQVSKGQFNRSFQGGQARVRFDGKAPVLYSFSAAENGSANVIFFNADQQLINQMKAAQNMIVDVEFAGQGKRQIAFKTAGLQWNSDIPPTP